MTNTKKLRELAEAATQGEWEAGAMSLGVYTPATNKPIAVLYDSGGDDFENQKANAGYIAAANPAAIIALLDRLEVAELDAKRIDWLLANADMGVGQWGREWDLQIADKPFFAPRHIEIVS